MKLFASSILATVIALFACAACGQSVSDYEKRAISNARKNRVAKPRTVRAYEISAADKAARDKAVQDKLEQESRDLLILTDKFVRSVSNRCDGHSFFVDASDPSMISDLKVFVREYESSEIYRVVSYRKSQPLSRIDILNGYTPEKIIDISYFIKPLSRDNEILFKDRVIVPSGYDEYEWHSLRTLEYDKYRHYLVTISFTSKGGSPYNLTGISDWYGLDDVKLIKDYLDSDSDDSPSCESLRSATKISDLPIAWIQNYISLQNKFSRLVDSINEKRIAIQCVQGPAAWSIFAPDSSTAMNVRKLLQGKMTDWDFAREEECEDYGTAIERIFSN